MMKPWRLWGIRTQILVFYLAATLFIVGAMGLALFFSTTRIVSQEVAKTTATAIDKSGRQLEMYIDQLKGLSDLLAESPQVHRYFDQSGPDDVAGDERRDIERMIQGMLNTNPEIASIILIGAKGQLITNEQNLEMHYSGDIQDQEWYQEALGSTMPILTSARMQEFSMDKDNWVISLGRELTDEKKKHLGVLRIDLKYDAIESILKDMSLGQEGYSYILNQSQQVVYHPNPQYFSQEEKRLELIDMLEMEGKELSREYKLTHRYNLNNSDWVLVGVASLDGVRRMEAEIIIVLVVLGSVLLLAAFGSSAIYASSVARPIRQLEKAMEEVEKGSLATEVGVVGSAEIASLSTHFLSMLDRIRELMQEIRNKEQFLRASELKTLYSQINPHFLYNTLDTIVWLAEFGNTERVITVSKAMARFFRLSLRGGSETTTVRDELDHVRQYLFIQKERYQDKLSYEIQAEDGLMDITIPKILLQPLVENAIYHGLRKMPGGGMIRITARKGEKEDLFLVVEDNGGGFEDAEKGKDPLRLGGVGLKNVAERIRLYYGEDYGLSIANRPGQGATIILRLKTTLPVP
ncbi:putative sensor with HAMP domain [Desulfitobacterium hafniense DCB-2]|uniref:Putative sensor with HAMP domain n=1 Tax=Desulfitobacterium hafniense (strain DSM 10664 / DCB-2) TaxID=272564 RepID=B8FWU3_DESHD|nr:sensor histidine kinase [Desulfitobacterium hafniense]ACL22591.1 putative sensor with HAMP domain [Desulfitobacterium hafniense DCB-2]